jgi:hypothetical protein
VSNKTTTPIQKTDDEIRDMIRRNHPAGITPHALIGAVNAWANYDDHGDDIVFTEHQRLVAISELLALHDAAEPEPTGLLAH